MVENREVRFEQDIETCLTKVGGWEKESFQDSNYDASVGIDLDKLVAFIGQTQPKQWERYLTIYQSDAKRKLMKRFDEEVNAHGMLYVLRNGIRDRGVTLKVAFFRPVSGLNEELQEKYEANRFTCTRQFAYSPNNRNTIDMVLSVNGIPLVALELKNQYTGQSVENALVQYQQDRNPKELVFNFNRRFLVYFAVDHYEVYMTTKLAGNKTYFLPFNQGSKGPGNNGGQGNPQNPDG